MHAFMYKIDFVSHGKHAMLCPVKLSFEVFKCHEFIHYSKRNEIESF